MIFPSLGHLSSFLIVLMRTVNNLKNVGKHMICHYHSHNVTKTILFFQRRHSFIIYIFM